PEDSHRYGGNDVVLGHLLLLPARLRPRHGRHAKARRPHTRRGHTYQRPALDRRRYVPDAPRGRYRAALHPAHRPLSVAVEVLGDQAGVAVDGDFAAGLVVGHGGLPGRGGPGAAAALL